VSPHPLRPHDLGPGAAAGRGEDSGGARTRVKVLTRGWAAALAALALGALYLAGPPQPVTARRAALGESAGQARALAFGPGGEVLAATMLDGTIRRWSVDPTTGRAGPLGPPLPGFVAAFAPDGATLAVGGLATVTLGHVASDPPRQTIRTEAGWTLALAFSRDGRLLAAAGERDVGVWDVATGRERAGRLPLRDVLSLAFAPDGRSLATGDKGGSIRLWDLPTGRQRLAVRAHARYVTSLAFSDDGRVLASASRGDGRDARLWDAATGRALAALRGHTGPVQSVAFAPGGRALATAGADETVRLWDVTTGRERATLPGHGVGAFALAFSPDGRALAAGGFEPEVLVWDVSGLPGR
jgi:WD40 repeat protein